MTQTVSVILYGHAPIEVTLNASLSTVERVVKKALGNLLNKLDTQKYRIFLDDDETPVRWVDEVPDDCKTITLLKLISITVIVDDYTHDPFDVLQGKTISEALCIGEFTDIVPSRHRISIGKYKLSSEYWDLPLDTDTILKIMSKSEVIPIELEPMESQSSE